MEESLQDALNNLEESGTVPAYLKDALISEIDFIRDAMQIVSLFGGVYFDTAAKVLTSLPDESEVQHRHNDVKE